MERAFIISGTGEKLVLSKATALHIPAELLHLDELEDKTWRIAYSTSLITDFKLVQALRFLGLQDGVPRPCQGVKVEFAGLDLTLELSKVTAIKSPARTLQLSRGKTGWLMLYSADLFPDLRLVKELTVHRVD